MDDRAAIEACRSGDAGAFRVLVERHQDRALARARSILLDGDAARDAVQEAFVDAWRSLDRFDAGRPFGAWLHVLVRHRCFKRLRAERARPASPLVGEPVLDETDRDAEARSLDEALRRLAPEDRELLLLKHVDGHTCAELAERLGVPNGTVMSRLFTARRRLRDALAAVDERVAAAFDVRPDPSDPPEDPP